MPRMNYSRPKFRLQERQVSDMRARDREHEKLVRMVLQPKPKVQPMLRISYTADVIRDASVAALAEGVERDVREIANDKFFNTSETVQAEVERRLAGLEHTLRLMAAFDERERARRDGHGAG